MTKKEIYFKSVKLKDVGPISELNHQFGFDAQGNPKPLVVVGGNGAGKSILLANLLNPIFLAQQQVFDDPDIPGNNLFKVRSPQYIRTGQGYSHAKVEFGDNFAIDEWNLVSTKEAFLKQPGKPDNADSSFDRIEPHENGSTIPNFPKPVDLTNAFNTNCVLYFPPNRFEEPGWSNPRILEDGAVFTDKQRFSRQYARSIIQQSPLKDTRNWLLDLVTDRNMYEQQVRQVPIREDIPALPVLAGYAGQCTTLWEAANEVIRLILSLGPDARFGIGPRHSRNVAVMRGQQQVIHDVFQLSTGQTSLLNISLSIMRDFDLTRSQFSGLADVTGVVFVDEIDAHLHTHTQCSVLPKLLKKFPKVQFIITSHSPLFLLGMKKELGQENFDLIQLPSGNHIDVEHFEEFHTAFDSFSESNKYSQAIENAITGSQKPVVFVEGDYDIKYIRKAADLFAEADFLDGIELRDANGFGGLNKIWKNLDCGLTIALPRRVGLVYDCDIKKENADRNLSRRRVVPTDEENPIAVGIENLFPLATVNSLIKSNAKFFDITPAIEKQVRGEVIVQPGIIEVNKNEKGNLCDWLCKNGIKEDFDGFDAVLDIIAEIAGLPRNRTNPAEPASDVLAAKEQAATVHTDISDDVAAEVTNEPPSES